MDIDYVSIELRDYVERMPRPVFNVAANRESTQLILEGMPTRPTEGVVISTVEEAGQGVRLYIPNERCSDGCLFWIHGGGYIIGRAKQDDGICGQTARALGVPVISAEYRLAPEWAFPTPLDDVHAAWSWLIANAAHLGISTEKIAVGGESAGGGLAAALVQRAIDEGDVFPKAQWLLSPMLDDRTATQIVLDEVDHFIWNNPTNRFAWHCYLGAGLGAEKTPDYAVPARRVDALAVYGMDPKDP